MGTVALFFYFYKGLKPQQTTSLIPCLDHDIQLLLAGSKVVCCRYVLYKYVQCCHPREMLGLWRRAGAWHVAMGGRN